MIVIKIPTNLRINSYQFQLIIQKDQIRIPEEEYR